MPSIENTRSQLQQLIAHKPSISLDLLFNYSPAFTHVHEFFSEAETLTGYCIGLLRSKEVKIKAVKWLVVSTDRQILFLYKGMFTELSHFSIPLEQVSSVSSRMGWLFGEINISDDKNTYQLYQLGKKDMKFFDEALTGTLAKFKRS